MRNYEFGCYPPVENAKLIELQFRLAHSYQCALVMIERERRIAVDDLYRAACPSEWAAFDAADQVAKAASDALRQSRSNGGDMLEPDEEMKAEQREIVEMLKSKLVEARAAQKIARQAWYDAKRAATPGLRSQIKAVQDEAYARNTRAYNLAGTVGLAWGTRLKIGEAVERAGKAAFAEGSLPRFPPFDGTGSIWVQLQMEWVSREDLPSAEMAEKLPTRLAVKDKNRWRAVERDGNALWFLNKTGGRLLDENEQPVRYAGSGLPRTEYHVGLGMDGVLAGTDTRVRLESTGMAAFQEARGKSATMSPPRTRWKCGACGHQWSGENAGSECRCGGKGAFAFVGEARDLPQPKQDGKAAGWQLGVVRLRVGSDERQPVWAAWPVRLQRDHLPQEGAAIKWACARSYKVGNRVKWRLLLTADDEQPGFRVDGPTLAVNLGWRNLIDGGLRVAYAVGSDGHKEEVRVPSAFINGIARVDSYRSIRDQRFEALKKDLKEWVEDGETGDKPEWLIEEVESIDYWRSQKRLARLLRQWWRQRFAGDDLIFDALLVWEKKDRHLRYWECDERESLFKMRRDFYCVTAARWATRYAHVFVTDMDLRDFAELPEPEDAAKSEGAEQRRSRTLASPSELRGAIENACSTRGACCPRVVTRARKKVEEGVCPAHVGVTKRLASPFKTQTCHACGIVFAFAAKQDLEHTCECGARWDQDYNHDMNLLASGGVTRGGGGSLAPSVAEMSANGEQRKGRWHKRRSKPDTQVVDSAKETG
jgi:hypothetical protein